MDCLSGCESASRVRVVWIVTGHCRLVNDRGAKECHGGLWSLSLVYVSQASFMLFRYLMDLQCVRSVVRENESF